MGALGSIFGTWKCVYKKKTEVSAIENDDGVRYGSALLMNLQRHLWACLHQKKQQVWTLLFQREIKRERERIIKKSRRIRRRRRVSFILRCWCCSACCWYAPVRCRRCYYRAIFSPAHPPPHCLPLLPYLHPPFPPLPPPSDVVILPPIINISNQHLELLITDK